VIIDESIGSITSLHDWHSAKDGPVQLLHPGLQEIQVLLRVYLNIPVEHINRHWLASKNKLTPPWVNPHVVQFLEVPMQVRQFWSHFKQLFIELNCPFGQEVEH
jgi:hypothetical protein